MKIIIDIPEEFEKDFKNDKFKDCLNRILVDCKGLNYEGLTGNYELETLDMLKKAFLNSTPIPKDAINGDIIKNLFPNCEQKEHIHNGYFEMYFDDDFGNASYMRISKDWWNATYKQEG